MLPLIKGDLASKLALLLVTALWGAAGQPIECDGDQFNCTDGYYCDTVVFKCRKCINCAEFNRNPPLDNTKKCITSVVDCGLCFEGLTEDVQGLQCVSAPVSPAYVWVAIALGGLLLFVAAVAIVVYVLRNTDTFRHFEWAHSPQSVVPTDSLGRVVNGEAVLSYPAPYHQAQSTTGLQQDFWGVSAASAPPPYSNGVQSGDLPRHEEATRPFLKPLPPTRARESAGNQEATVFNIPAYEDPPLPTNHHAAESGAEEEFLVDDETTESLWRPDDVADNSHVDNSESGSSSAPEAAAAAAALPAAPAPLSAQLAAASGTTLVRPPCQDIVPAKVPRLRQDTNNNRNNGSRDDGDGEPPPRSAGFGTVNIHFSVQQINDVKL